LKRIICRAKNKPGCGLFLRISSVCKFRVLTRRPISFLFEATQLQRRALYTEATSYANALKLNNAALKNLERIISKNPSSDPAARLASGQTRFEGCTMDQFKVNQVVLEGKARAEKDPLLCALLPSKMIDKVFERTRAYSRIHFNASTPLRTSTKR
jgi:hypothetical protein